MQWGFCCSDARRALAYRREYALFLRSVASPDSDFFGAEVIFGELVANVIRHSSGPIEVRVECRDEIVLNVGDKNDAGTELAVPPFDPNAEGGRGLYLVKTLGRGLRVRPLGRGKEIEVVLPLLRRHVRRTTDLSRERRLRESEAVTGPR